MRCFSLSLSQQLINRTFPFCSSNIYFTSRTYFSDPQKHIPSFSLSKNILQYFWKFWNLGKLWGDQRVLYFCIFYHFSAEYFLLNSEYSRYSDIIFEYQWLEAWSLWEYVFARVHSLRLHHSNPTMEDENEPSETKIFKRSLHCIALNASKSSGKLRKLSLFY